MKCHECEMDGTFVLHAIVLGGEDELHVRIHTGVCHTCVACADHRKVTAEERAMAWAAMDASRQFTGNPPLDRKAVTLDLAFRRIKPEVRAEEN